MSTKWASGSSTISHAISLTSIFSIRGYKISSLISSAHPGTADFRSTMSESDEKQPPFVTMLRSALHNLLSERNKSYRQRPALAWAVKDSILRCHPASPVLLSPRQMSDLWDRPSSSIVE
ncbi:hypothetical protein N7494_009940 [Penicillium frequentans]|uniref:Uncharacterized protein n=1 Tax=Penicillium frequentans TaxID=3151616 RepID=A0AAD6GDW5_9EURO|nr:hypothetical protein N7494_009940 [Penicillium glabrum]